MFSINRQLFIVRFKQPFIDWANSLPDAFDPPVTLDSTRKDSTVYLVPTCWTIEEAREYIDPFKSAIFASELMDWCRDEEDWPEDFNGLFDEWIELEYHSVVRDLALLPVVKRMEGMGQDENEIEERHSVDAYRERIHEAFFPPSTAADEIAMTRALEALVDFQELVADPVGQQDLTLTTLEEALRYARTHRNLPPDFYDALKFLFDDFSRMLNLMPGLSKSGNYRNRLRRLRQQATGVDATFRRWLIDAINGSLKEMTLH